MRRLPAIVVNHSPFSSSLIIGHDSGATHNEKVSWLLPLSFEASMVVLANEE